MNASVEVAVVGAGPYGLSLAAHLDAAGISTRVFGRPMDSWRSHMPEGMLLKSDPFASNLSDAQDFYTLARFSQEHSLPYNESEPVKLNTFCNYGLDFQKRCVPRLTEVHVNTIERNGDEFTISLDDGGRVSARRVVIAIGVGPFRYVPEILGGLPERFVSHSFDRRDLSVLSGARVAVIGGGSSAIDLAGLAHERGCDVTSDQPSRSAEIYRRRLAAKRSPSMVARIASSAVRVGAGVAIPFQHRRTAVDPRVAKETPI